MASGNTRIGDPASLKKAGGGAVEVAGLTNTAGGHPVGETEAAAKSFGSGEWDGALGGALTELAASWGDKTAALVSKVRTIGTQCTNTANNYTTTETVNTTTMSSLQQQASPFG